MDHIVGGRAASGLQGEYGHAGSTPDLLGGLGLIASRCPQSDQSGSVYFGLLCLVVGRIGSRDEGLEHTDYMERLVGMLPVTARADL